jgi:hypothetical protein
MNIIKEQLSKENYIDLEKKRETDLKKIKEYTIRNTIKNLEDNYELKVSLVNIDSRFRNKNPKNILDGIPQYLNNNPITITKNSNKVKVYYPNHNFIIGDKIVFKNVTNNDIILSNSIYLLNNFDYFLININNHNITKDIIINDFKIAIDINDNITIYDRLIGNIPLNSIIGQHNLYILDEKIDNNISNDNVLILMTNLNITRSELCNNYVFIKLPFNFYNENKQRNNITYDIFHNLKKILTIKYFNIGGINLNYLNADYPINYSQYQHCHQISEIDTNYFYFNSPIYGKYTLTSGGSNIYVAKILNTIDGYLDANNYIIDLKKTFNNVVRLEMITSEIPYIDFNIKNNINNTNNKLYWKYYEDGDYIYNITLPEGNYTPTRIIQKLEFLMNKIERVYSINTNKIYNIFKINYDITTNEFIFKSYKQNFLPSSITIEKDITIGENYLKLIVKHPNNFVNIGDEINIFGSKQIGDISASNINKTHIVYNVNKLSDTYSVLININIDKNYEDININGNGGIGIKVTISALTSFLFNKPNTIGSILGFKNCGDINSITKYSQITSNFSDYINSTIYNNIGGTNINNSLITMNGNNYYLLLYLNDYEGIITNNEFDNAFSKILLTGVTGDIMFNTFVNSPLEFEIPINSINQFKIKFLYPDGTMPDFRNFDHSFTLRITEKITKPINTRINPNNYSYHEGLIDYYNPL